MFLLFLAGMTMVIVVGARTPPVQTRSLPDGSTVSLAAVTWGPEHRFVRRAPWAAGLARLLPGPLGGVLGVHTKEKVPEGNPVLWLTCRTISNSVLGAGSALTVFDEHGCESSVLGATHWQGEVFSIAPSAYPRGGRVLGIRGYNYGQKKPVFEFRIPEWKPQPYAQWKPERLPAVRHAEGVDWTLQRFVTGMDLHNPDRPGRVYEDGGWTRILLAPRRNGKLTREWEPVALRIIGASGNVYDPGVQYSNIEWTGEGYKLFFGGNLFSEEAAWKVQVELARAHDAIPRAVKRYHFRGVPAKQPRPAASWQIEPPGTWVDLPTGSRFGVAGMAQTSRALPCVYVQFEGDRGASWPILMGVRDDRGRSLLPWRGMERVADYSALADFGISQQFELPLKGIFKDSKTVDVTIALTETRLIEFLAAPTRPGG